MITSENISEEVLKFFNKYFSEPKLDGATNKVLVWYDEDGQNKDFIDELASDYLAVFKFDKNPMKLEYEISRLPKEQNVLIYVPTKPDMTSKNPLISIESKNPGCVFVPDEVNMILKNLGLTNEYRAVVDANKRFFKNKKRGEKIKQFLPEVSNPDDLERAFICANFDADHIRLDRMLVAVFRAYSEDEKTFNNDLKYIDAEALNSILSKYFAFKGANTDNFEDLLERIVLSYFVFSLDGISMVPRLNDYILPSEAASSVNLFIRDISSDKTTEKYYYKLSDKIAKKFEISNVLEQLPLESYVDSDAFTTIDESIISKLLTKIDNNESVANDLKSRRNKLLRDNIRNAYDMIYYADRVLNEINKNLTSITESDRDKLTKLYAEKLYLIDQLYRKFNVAYNLVSSVDEYRSLAEHVENIYNREYLFRLSEKWSDSIANIDWKSGNIEMQSDFYAKNLAPLDEKRDRVFVIISDAMRYEVAVELSNKLRVSGADVSIEPMIGVVPSYTQLGMAALLPHKTLKIDSSTMQVSNELLSTAGTANRDKILKDANENNMAIKYSDLRSHKKSDWKTLFSGKKYVYIYHDTIDNAGEHNESEVFEACDKAIDEIETLISDLHTTFSGTSVFVTSDHGFLYRRSDIVRFQDDDAEAKKKDRFAISNQSGNEADTLSYKLDYLDKEDERFVNVPRGDMVYGKKGATGNYLHGGAMPQEVIVPKLSFKSTRNTNDLPKVKVLYNGISTKITNAITFLNFVQDEPVSNNKAAARYKVFFIDDDNNRISDEVTIIADSTESDLENRSFREKFTFASRNYDKNANYHMIIEEEGGGGTPENINFKIDIMMSLL